MAAWHDQPNNPDSETDGLRHMSGGYDFGGYVPGEDYLPKKRRWHPLIAVVAALTIVSLLVWSVVVIF